MISDSSDNERKRYFCDEPWVGMFTIQTNQDVTFCPCYLKMKIGNLQESSIQAIWNAEPLVQLRRSFSEGVLPEPCRSQLCPVAVGVDENATGQTAVTLDRSVASDLPAALPKLKIRQ